MRGNQFLFFFLHEQIIIITMSESTHSEVTRGYLFSAVGPNTCENDIHMLHVGRGVEIDEYPAASFTLNTFDVYSNAQDAPSLITGKTFTHPWHPHLCNRRCNQKYELI